MMKVWCAYIKSEIDGTRARRRIIMAESEEIASTLALQSDIPSYCTIIVRPVVFDAYGVEVEVEYYGDD